MTVTLEQAQTYLGASAADTDEVTRALQVAGELINAYVGAATTVPAVVADQALLEVTATVFRRRHSPGGQAAGAVMLAEGVVVREPADPLTVTRSILDPYLRRGLA